ncbi:WXG100 family type VII secretion target [Streptomyces sp. GS7]|uniref:WXG100 family type VII secretion target n=1 Tax=Streptomyces sp. GS7 TaxID=2692234 RepID=UPI0013183A5B|nr:WXG100 family type VII secretion target [Streptomyces sp. GS7]QHC24565.1 WXG100 family type VII secretion target [Streptomyces sp. GS7]
MTNQQQEQQEQRMQVEQIEVSFDLFAPDTAPSALRSRAEAWRRLAHDLKTTIEARDQEVTRLGDNWTGAASDTFHARWSHTKEKAEKVLPHFAAVAEQLDHTADAIQKANAEHVHRQGPVGGHS